MKYKVIHHATIKFYGDKVIYFDPYKIDEEIHDADYIFITHDHYDHYDINSINNIKKETTKIILPKCLKEAENYLIVNSNSEYTVDDIKFNTVSSYNTNKNYHPKEKEYVGYNILLDGTYYYIMGDTDRTKESENIKTDVCFVPIGGTYTMDYLEASKYINDIKPKKAIPIHYGMIVGENNLGIKFKNNIINEIEVELFI